MNLGVVERIHNSTTLFRKIKANIEKVALEKILQKKLNGKNRVLYLESTSGRCQAGPKGRYLEVGPRRAPRLLVCLHLYFYFCVVFVCILYFLLQHLPTRLQALWAMTNCPAFVFVFFFYLYLYVFVFCICILYLYCASVYWRGCEMRRMINNLAVSHIFCAIIQGWAFCGSHKLSFWIVVGDFNWMLGNTFSELWIIRWQNPVLVPAFQDVPYPHRHLLSWLIYFNLERTTINVQK